MAAASTSWVFFFISFLFLYYSIDAAWFKPVALLEMLISINALYVWLNWRFTWKTGAALVYVIILLWVCKNINACEYIIFAL